MCSQVLYIATAYCMFRPVMFSIFSICTLYFVDKVYHTNRPTNQYELHIHTVMTQLLRHYYMSHLCYFVGKLRVNSHVNLVAQFKPKLYTCTCEQCMICACYV